jgi:hypothetical protein
MNLPTSIVFMASMMNVSLVLSLPIFNLSFIGKRRYSVKVWRVFCDCFNCLPVAGVVSESIICMHGGNVIAF